MNKVYILILLFTIFYGGISGATDISHINNGKDSGTKCATIKHKQEEIASKLESLVKYVHANRYKIDNSPDETSSMKLKMATIQDEASNLHDQYVIAGCDKEPDENAPKKDWYSLWINRNSSDNNLSVHLQVEISKGLDVDKEWDERCRQDISPADILITRNERPGVTDSVYLQMLEKEKAKIIFEKNDQAGKLIETAIELPRCFVGCTDKDKLRGNGLHYYTSVIHFFKDKKQCDDLRNEIKGKIAGISHVEIDKNNDEKSKTDKKYEKYE